MRDRAYKVANHFMTLRLQSMFMGILFAVAIEELKAD